MWLILLYATLAQALFCYAVGYTVRGQPLAPRKFKDLQQPPVDLLRLVQRFFERPSQQVLHRPQ
jgi:hypothetical protein